MRFRFVCCIFIISRFLIYKQAKYTIEEKYIFVWDSGEHVETRVITVAVTIFIQQITLWFYYPFHIFWSIQRSAIIFTGEARANGKKFSCVVSWENDKWIGFYSYFCFVHYR